MKTRKILRGVLSELREGANPFSVRQKRHIKVSVFNPVSAQTAVLILGVSPSDVNAEKAFLKQCRVNLEKIGISKVKHRRKR